MGERHGLGHLARACIGAAATFGGSGAGVVDGAFNANRNDFWKMDYTLQNPARARIRMQVSGCGLTETHMVYNGVPYLVTHSYEQVARITYRVSQDSYVTVKLLPPGVSDPAHASAIVLTANTLQTATTGGSPTDHVIEWRGYDEVDTCASVVSVKMQVSSA